LAVFSTSAATDLFLGKRCFADDEQYDPWSIVSDSHDTPQFSGRLFDDRRIEPAVAVAIYTSER
jgi:hypothetical protein